MTSHVKTALLALVAVIGLGAVSLAHAQMSATMPILYSQSGTAVNTGTGYLASGIYYLAGGVSVEYYGNGTYYNPSIGQYGGSIHDQNGTAGALLGYGTNTGNYQVAVMPALFSQNGAQVNLGNSYLNPGYYYLTSNGSVGGSQVQYYGNGTYYNPTIGQYGGNISNWNGTAGVSLGYSA
jgi:hypothetical protein